MKIVHLLESINPATGGPVKSVSSLAVAQAMQGHDVTLACYVEPDHEIHKEQIAESHQGMASLCIEGIKMEGVAEKVFAVNVRKMCDRLFRHVDVVHVHGIWRPFNISACRMAIRSSKKLVITPHGMLDPWSMSQRYIKKFISMKLIWKKLLKSAFFVHALNADEARLMRPLGLTAPVRVFPNGVFPEHYMHLPDPSKFRDAYPQLGKHPYVLFLSRLHYKKGLDYLIEAFAELCESNADVHLVIAGPDGGMLDGIKRWISEKHLERRVHIVGSLHGELKWSALVGAECFCLPSRQEGFSMAICEALIAKVPVVISEQCHFPEVAEVNAGIIVPLTAEAISQGLERAVSDMTWREQARLAGHNLMVSRFDWRNIASEMLTSYARA